MPSKTCKHEYETDGGPCIRCGCTVAELMMARSDALKIPSALQPSENPQEGDLCVKDGALMTWQSGNKCWKAENYDPRIVAAVCRCAWLDEGFDVVHTNPEQWAKCQRQAELWRRHGEGAK